MAAAYIEHRPKSTDPNASTSHFVILVNGAEAGSFRTSKEAKDKACADGHRPGHVARVRHLQDRDKPDHWRVDPCFNISGRIRAARVVRIVYMQQYSR